MKLSKKIFHLPPYLSTSWEEIASLSYEPKENILKVFLKNGKEVEIPSLNKEQIEKIFSQHAEILGQGNVENISFNLPLENLGGGLGLESLGSLMQHDPSQKNAAPLPKEILSKVASLSKMMGLGKIENLPEAEPHCNCLHCQFARALNFRTNEEAENEDETVLEEELQFRTWNVEPQTDKLYLVINPFDSKESYRVFLGEPIGCTCGKNNCEHIRAVLHS